MAWRRQLFVHSVNKISLQLLQKANPSTTTLQDGKHGKAYGILTWRGQQQNEVPRRINGAAKKVWRVLGGDRPADDEWPSLVAPSLLEKSEPNDVDAPTTSSTTESGTLS